MSSRFTAQLGLLDARIEREIRRLRARYQLSLDEFRGLYVSDEQVDRLLADAGAPVTPERLPRPADGARNTDGRWRRLVETFGLSSLDEDLLLMAAAPELDRKYETLYAYVNDDVTRKWPTADLARRLLVDVDDVDRVLAALAPAATLQARRLVRRVDPPTGRPAALNAGFALDPCVVQWLHGSSPALAIGGDAICWSPNASLPSCPDAVRGRAVPVARLFTARDDRRAGVPVVALRGRPGAGRASIAAAVAAAIEAPLVRIDVSAVPVDGDDALERLGVSLALEPAVVLIEGFEPATGDDTRHARSANRLARAMAGWPASTPILLRVDDDEGWRSYAGDRRIVEVRCGGEGFAERVEHWRTAADAIGTVLSETDLQGLAGRFDLTRGQVRATVATARDVATMRGAAAVDLAHIGAAVRLTSGQGIERLATKVERAHEWTDLVLPGPTLRRLHELAAAIRLRHVVYDAWGFGERIVSGLGINALFAGASGTGKTMAAGVIARELGLELYKIDLSGVVSKYIGETEKNLDRIFRAARTANAIVFLDEAEAIMGKRSEVKDAHDRYANIEVAYLLQKLEEHDGIVILASNLKHNIDDAFSRRMQYVIDFPRPDEHERQRIWRGMFPSRCPLGSDVDFAFLARHFDLAGGDIRNVALDAAFLAAQDGGTIGMGAIVDALARQLTKEGKTPTGGQFRQYQGLLAKAGG